MLQFFQVMLELKFQNTRAVFVLNDRKRLHPPAPAGTILFDSDMNILRGTLIEIDNPLAHPIIERQLKVRYANLIVDFLHTRRINTGNNTTQIPGPVPEFHHGRLDALRLLLRNILLELGECSIEI
ncbi:hypothetical protein RHRU231_450228 [Rhodococcus ruber]|uniref:Uncharacterized protein n=1 Tax=Rhodococcus ruber TaxID=1830 RepID=A0A098BMW7_9NOCA|nr:hypothetical protein RHRU231_450228 [Rhodococcus ruber]